MMDKVILTKIIRRLNLKWLNQFCIDTEQSITLKCFISLSPSMRVKGVEPLKHQSGSRTYHINAFWKEKTLTHSTSLKSGLHFPNTYPGKFTGLSPFQMQRDLFRNVLCQKNYDKLKPRIV